MYQLEAYIRISGAHRTLGCVNTDLWSKGEQRSDARRGRCPNGWFRDPAQENLKNNTKSPSRNGLLFICLKPRNSFKDPRFSIEIDRFSEFGRRSLSRWTQVQRAMIDTQKSLASKFSGVRGFYDTVQLLSSFLLYSWLSFSQPQPPTRQVGLWWACWDELFVRKYAVVSCAAREARENFKLFSLILSRS